MQQTFYCDPCGDERGWPRQIVAVKGRCQVCGEEAMGSQTRTNCLPTPAHIRGQLRFVFEDPNRPPKET